MLMVLNPSTMKVFTSVFTYLPFAYFIFISFGISFFNHIWFHQMRPYTDLSVCIINSIVFFSKNYVVNNMLMYHVWNAFILATYALAFNSIYTVMFEEFLIDDTLYKVMLSLLYVSIIFVCHYVLMSSKSMILIHVLFMYLPLERNWILNLIAFDAFIIFFVVTQFADVAEYKLSDKKLAIKPLVISYMYLCINEITLGVIIFHAVLEYYYGKEIKVVEVNTDVLDVVEEAYHDAIKKIKTVKFSDEVRISPDEINSFMDNEHDNEYMDDE